MAENYYHDLVSHSSWRSAMVKQRDAAESTDDEAYWNHEIGAFDRLVEFHKALSLLPEFTDDPVEVIASVLVAEKTDPTYIKMAGAIKGLRHALLDEKDLLREENRRHQKAAVDRDDLRAQLAELTKLPAAGRAHELAELVAADYPEIAEILRRVETNRTEYELGRKVNAETQRQLEHERWRRGKAEGDLAIALMQRRPGSGRPAELARMVRTGQTVRVEEVAACLDELGVIKKVAFLGNAVEMQQRHHWCFSQEHQTPYAAVARASLPEFCHEPRCGTDAIADRAELLGVVQSMQMSLEAMAAMMDRK